jgi:hypothetical protein
MGMGGFDILTTTPKCPDLTAMGMGGFDILPTTSKCPDLTDDDEKIDGLVSVEAANTWLALHAPPRELPVWDVRWQATTSDSKG